MKGEEIRRRGRRRGIRGEEMVRRAREEMVKRGEKPKNYLSLYPQGKLTRGRRMLQAVHGKRVLRQRVDNQDLYMINHEDHMAAYAANKVTREIRQGKYSAEYLKVLLDKIKPTEEVLKVPKNKAAIEDLRRAASK